MGQFLSYGAKDVRGLYISMIPGALFQVSCGERSKGWRPEA